MVRIGIIGASGRMGRELIQATLDNPRAELAAAVTRPGNALLGTDAGELIGAGRLGVDLGADLETALATVDVAIDFTLADALTANLAACQATGRPMVVGTTGLTAAHRRVVDVAARDIPMVLAPNFSAGISLAFRLIEMAARALGDDFDVEVIEAHHRHKVDAPSGTAVRMGEVLAGALDRDLATCAVYGREGQIGARERRTIGFETIRGGDIVGEHTVLFAGLGERLEITHRASSRMTFASGAVRAAVWLHEQAPGLYGMEDVLGLRQG